MKHLLLILSIFLLTSPLFCQETGALFQYKISSGFVWKTFGKDKVQPKYEGEVSDGIPDGFGIPFYYYDEFMQFNNFYEEAQVMIDNPTFQNDINFFSLTQ